MVKGILFTTCICTCTFLVFSISLSGCLRVGPDYRRPEINISIPSSYKNTLDKSEWSCLERELKWDKLFPRLGLKELVQEVRKGNWDIKMASQKIIEARLRLAQQKALMYPELKVDASAQRQERPVIGIIPGKSFSTKTDTFVLSAAASYEVDVWGKISRAGEAALAEAMAAQESRRTVQLTVEAEAVTQYVKMGIIRRRIQIAERRIENYERTMRTIEARYERGLAELLDLQKAKSALSQARAVLPQLRKEMTQAGQQLSFLLGRYPEAAKVKVIGSEYVKNLPSIPPGLPSELLLRRPDIRSAENRLKALNARVGVARANRFPRISLTGTYGYSSSELDVLIGPGSVLWNIAAGLVQPIFNGGRLKAEEKAAMARFNQGVAEYGKTVLRAFLEVENALVTRRREMERRKKLEDFLVQSKMAEGLARTRYEKGLTDYLNMLDAQRTTYEAEDALALVDLALLTNRVALIRALGGGWDEENGKRYE